MPLDGLVMIHVVAGVEAFEDVDLEEIDNYHGRSSTFIWSHYSMYSLGRIAGYLSGSIRRCCT